MTTPRIHQLFDPWLQRSPERVFLHLPDLGRITRVGHRRPRLGAVHVNGGTLSSQATAVLGTAETL